MNLTQAFKIAVKSIAAKKARSALTMLGVIIGLAAVIILVSYAEGQNRQMREYYESLGNNVVNINAYSPSGRDLTKTIRDYCMEDLDDYILGLTPTVDYYDQTILKYGAKSMDSNNSNWDESPQLVMGNQDYSLCNNFTIARAGTSPSWTWKTTARSVSSAPKSPTPSSTTLTPWVRRSPSTASPSPLSASLRRRTPTTCPVWTAMCSFPIP